MARKKKVNPLEELIGGLDNDVVGAAEDYFAGLDSNLDDAVMVDKKKSSSSFVAEGQLVDAAEALAFMTAGKATFTVRSKKTNTRFTFRVRAPKDEEGKIDYNAAVKFVSLLNGPDNTSNYVYIGYVKRGVYYHGGAKAKVQRDAPSNQAFEWVWRKLTQGTMPDSLEVWHEGQCGRCGRKLTVPSSISSGIGPECATRGGM